MKKILSSVLIAALSILLGIYLRRFWTNRTGEKIELSLISVRAPLAPMDEYSSSYSSLEEEYYRRSCPPAERVVRNGIKKVYQASPSIAPSLIRLLFHDCFIEGCDGSVLLDSAEDFASEKEAAPNLSLKGLDVIDQIKNQLENICPGVVSCADVIVLSARECVKVAGGPRYPLKTGRKDSVQAYKERAERELPSPHASLSDILSSFNAKGFSERETVVLSGAHSIGITHCTFIEDRLYNFSGTGKPDPELDPGFLQELKTKCPSSASASPSQSPRTGLAPSKSHCMSLENRSDGVVDLSFDSCDSEFGVSYYRRLIDKKGVMFSDQQLMAREETARWVRAYASDQQMFRQDFASAMIKLSSYRVLTGPTGQVRTNCSRLLNALSANKELNGGV